MNSCNLCEGKQLYKLIDFGAHPIAHDYLKTPSNDEYVHPVTLYFCETCGHIQLINPIPPDLLYENYVCLSSWKHQPHIPRLARIIEELNDIKKTSTILEVGSNDGRFLQVLKEHGYKKIIGMEPAHDAQIAAGQKGVITIPSYFNKKTAEGFVENYGHCDLFISRQMLEHINDLKDFHDAMDVVLSPGGFVVFEVPNFNCSLDTLDYTLWEEHVNYFTLETLTRFLAYSGIKIIHSEKILFSGEALIVIGKKVGVPLEPPKDYMEALRAKAINYSKSWPKFRNAFIKYLDDHKTAGGKVAVYGAGARVNSLINFVGLGPYIEFIVDDQQEKQGLFVPGSNLPILSGDALEKYSIDLCLLAVNTESEEKAISKHPEFIKKGGKFISVLPPSELLPHFWKRLIEESKI